MAKRRQTRTERSPLGNGLPEEFASSRDIAWSTAENTIAWCLEHGLLAPHPSWLDDGPYGRRRVAFEAWALANLPLVDDKPDVTEIKRMNIHGLLHETVRERLARLKIGIAVMRDR